MQIVAGRFRHRRLETNPGDTTRPLLTRVKVSLFDRLQPWLPGSRVADICSGTGTIGLEALSRGAHRVVFFEFDPQAFDLLRRNIRTLGVQDETITWKTDITKCSFRPKEGEDFLPYDLIFFDPPYRHLETMKPGTMLYRSLVRLAKPAVSAPSARLFVRCSTHTELSLPPVWTLAERLDYSSMSIHIFTKTPGLVAELDELEAASAVDEAAEGGSGQTTTTDPQPPAVGPDPTPTDSDRTALPAGKADPACASHRPDSARPRVGP